MTINTISNLFVFLLLICFYGYRFFIVAWHSIWSLVEVGVNLAVHRVRLPMLLVIWPFLVFCHPPRPSSQAHPSFVLLHSARLHWRHRCFLRRSLHLSSRSRYPRLLLRHSRRLGPPHPQTPPGQLHHRPQRAAPRHRAIAIHQSLP